MITKASIHVSINIMGDKLFAIKKSEELAYFPLAWLLWNDKVEWSSLFPWDKTPWGYLP